MTEVNLLPFGNPWSLLDAEDKEKDHSVLIQLSNINWKLKLFCQLFFFSFTPSKFPRGGDNLAPQVCIQRSTPVAIQFGWTIYSFVFSKVSRLIYSRVKNKGSLHQLCDINRANIWLKINLVVAASTGASNNLTIPALKLSDSRSMW